MYEYIYIYAHVCKCIYIDVCNFMGMCVSMSEFGGEKKKERDIFGIMSSTGLMVKYYAS